MQSLGALVNSKTDAGLNQPPFDARLDDDDFVAFLDVPGLAEAPTISIGRDRLVVEGLQTVRAGDARARRRSRSRCRPFSREIALPPGVDPDLLQLHYVAGVLRINIPARAMSRPT